MARSWFGGTGADWIAGVYEFAGQRLPALEASTAEVWTDRAAAGGRQVTDLLDVNGAAMSTVTSDVNGQVPAFQAEDGLNDRVLLSVDHGVSGVWLLNTDGTAAAAARVGAEAAATTATNAAGDAITYRDAAQAAADAAVAPTDTQVASLIPDLNTATGAGLAAAFAGRSALVSDVNEWALASVSHIDHLAGVATKLQQAPYRRFNITGLGHSLLFGYWSNDDASQPESDPRIRQRGTYRVAQQNLCRRFGVPDPGEGIILNSDTRVTQSGTQAIGSTGITMGPPGGYRLADTGDTLTLTLTEKGVTEIWVHGWQENDAKCGPWTYTIDGGADQICTTAQGFPTNQTDYDYTVKIRGLSPDSLHTLVIKGATGNQIDIAGFSVWGDPTRGIAFSRMAVGGGYLNTAVYLSTGAQNPRSNRLTLLRPETDLLVIQYGTNEMTVSGQAAGHTPTTYSAQLTDFVNVATNTYNIPVLLVSSNYHNPSAGVVGTYGEDAFYNVHETIAAANPKVAHWDWRDLPEFASYSTALANGLMYGTDAIHTSSKGALLCGLAFEAIIASLAGNRIAPLA